MRPVSAFQNVKVGVFKISVIADDSAVRLAGSRHDLAVRGNGDAVDVTALGEVQIAKPGNGTIGQGKTVGVQTRLGWCLGTSETRDRENEQKTEEPTMHGNRPRKTS